MSATLKDRYRDASIHVQNVDSAESKANLDTYRWKLYGLHKQVMEGDCPHNDAGPGSSAIMVNKWKAWVDCKGMSREESMDAFCKLVKIIDPQYNYTGSSPKVGSDIAEVKTAQTKQAKAQQLMQRNAVSKNGLLRKMSDWKKNWEIRYFVLQKGTMSYYLKKGDPEPRKKLSLVECNVEKKKDTTLIEGKVCHGFSVAHSGLGLLWSLVCDTEEERDEWVKAIHEVKGIPVSGGVQESKTSAVVLSSATQPAASNQSTSSAASSSTGAIDASASGAIPSPTENVPAQFVENLEACIRNLLAATANDGVAGGVGDGWERMYEKDGMIASRKPGEKIIVKGTAELPYSVLDIFSTIVDVGNLQKLNPQVDRTQKLVVFNRQSSTNHVVFKEVWPTAVRDMVNFSHWRLLPNGTVVIASFNAETFHSSTGLGADMPVPLPVKSAVRANLLMGGYVLVPNITAGTTRVSYVVSSDLMGRILASVSNHVARNQPLIVLAIAKTLSDMSSEKIRSPKEAADHMSMLSISKDRGALNPPKFGQYVAKAVVSTATGSTKKDSSASLTGQVGDGKAGSSVEGPPVFIFYTLVLPFLLAYVMEKRFLGFAIGAFVCLPYVHRQLLVGQPIENKYSNNVEFNNALPRGRVIVQLSVELGKLLRYVESKREEYGMDVSLTHVVTAAAAKSLFSFQSLNGCIIGNQFYRSRNTSIALSVSAENSDMIAVKIEDAQAKAINVIADELQAKSRSVRRAITTGAGAGGGEKAVAGTSASGGGPASRAGIILEAMPYGINYGVRYLLRLAASYYGMSFPGLGIMPYPHGTCNIITAPRDPSRPDALELDVGVMMVPDSDGAVSSPPVVITIGGISLKTALDSDRKPTATPVLNLAVSIDCRAVGFAQGRQFASVLQSHLNDLQDD